VALPSAGRPGPWSSLFSPPAVPCSIRGISLPHPGTLSALPVKIYILWVGIHVLEDKGEVADPKPQAECHSYFTLWVGRAFLLSPHLGSGVGSRAPPPWRIWIRTGAGAEPGFTAGGAGGVLRGCAAFRAPSLRLWPSFSPQQPQRAVLRPLLLTGAIVVLVVIAQSFLWTENTKSHV